MLGNLVTREEKMFKVGDRVECVEGYEGITKGMTGIVVRESNSTIYFGVQWDGFQEGHDCDGNAKTGTGWYVPPRCLSLINKEGYITLKDILEKGACKDGIRWFANKFADEKVSFGDLFKTMKRCGCPKDWEKWVREKFNIREEEKYKIGDRFLESDGTEHILAYFNDGEKKALLVSLKTGNRWHEPQVVNDSYNITKDEFEKITGGESSQFKKIVKEVK